MAEMTNVGMAVFIADITSMCRFGSDGAAALLSACTMPNSYVSLRQGGCLEYNNQEPRSQYGCHPLI